MLVPSTELVDTGTKDAGRHTAPADPHHGCGGETAGLQSKLSDLKHDVKAEKKQAQQAQHALITQHQAGTRHCRLFI